MRIRPSIAHRMMVVQVGVFQMQEQGLMPVADPSHLFVSNRSLAPGVSSAVTVMMEGTRPMLLEVQALTSPVPQVRTSITLASSCCLGRGSRIAWTCFRQSYTKA